MALLSEYKPENLYFLMLQINVQARDLGAPARYGYAVCTVSMQRNFNPPVFVQPSYSATIMETYALGDTILRVNATDRDPLVSKKHVPYFFGYKTEFLSSKTIPKI